MEKENLPLLLRVPLHLLYVVLGLLIGLAMMTVCVIRAFVPSCLLPKKSVQDQIVLITGAGGGLGRMLAIRFAKLGAKVVLIDVNEAALAETISALPLESTAFSYVCDLCNRNEIYQVADRIRQEVGHVDIVVNNAGLVSGKRLLDSNDALIAKTFEVNTLALFWVTKAFLPNMVERNHGHVVCIASAGGLVGCSGLTDYCSSKFAAIGFSETLYMELRALKATGVKVTTVCPFYMNSGMFQGVKTRMPLLLPILNQDYVADKTIDGILTNQELLYIPRSLYILAATKAILPVKVSVLLADYFGINSTMDNFVGHAR